MDEDRRKLFHEAMGKSGWRPVTDIFGIIIRWRHEGTKRVVDNAPAEEYWNLSGQVPIPF